MASLINKLSAILVSKLDKAGYYGDGGGLWLQVSPTKSKSWIFRFTLAGKQHEMGLGSLNTVDMAAARVKARECRQMLLEGIDPLASRRDARTARTLTEAKRITFDQCAAAYIDAHRGSWKNPQHVAQWKARLRLMRAP